MNRNYITRSTSVQTRISMTNQASSLITDSRNETVQIHWKYNVIPDRMC